jgi:hypothetical protein
MLYANVEDLDLPYTVKINNYLRFNMKYKKIQVSYWQGKILDYEPNEIMKYSLATRNKIINEALNAGYYIFLKCYKETLIMCVSPDRFDRR